MIKLYEIKLNIDELKLLNNQVNDKAQKIIDNALKEVSFGFDLPLINEILLASTKLGKLTWSHQSIKYCDYCDKNYAYYKYPRHSIHHRKGENNYNKPFLYPGWIFNKGFISIANHGDICRDCAESHGIFNKLINYIVDNNLKIEIQQNDIHKTIYLKDEKEICYNCKKGIFKSEMIPKSTWGNNNMYPAKCPYCSHESNAWASKMNKITSDFRMIKLENAPAWFINYRNQH